METILNISQKTKKHYLDKCKNIPDKLQLNYRIRKMSRRLHKEFDEVWVKYENGDATFDDWKKSLNKWLQSELI